MYIDSITVYDRAIEPSVLVGKTFSSVTNDSNLELVFKQDNGDVYIFSHRQDGCEQVYIYDICGDLDDLTNSPLLQSDVETSDENKPDIHYIHGDKDNPIDTTTPTLYWDGSFTWTFYKFSTIKGSVTIRWLGASNGFYSEAVELYKVNP